MIKKNYIYGVLTLLFANPAYAVLDCKQQPSCESLGYVDTDVSDCPVNAVLACPFDPKYKKCVAVSEAETPDCTNYNLPTCPDAGICVSCTDESTTKYALASCKNGYIKINDKCIKTYESCESAGYWTEHENRTCSTAAFIYLSDGRSKECYSGCGECNSGYALEDPDDEFSKCVEAFSSCSAAGYWDENEEDKEHRVCKGTIDIPLESGNYATCRTGCTCEDGYIENKSGGCDRFYSCVSNGYFDNPTAHAECKSKRYIGKNATNYCLDDCQCERSYAGIYAEKTWCDDEYGSCTLKCVRVYHSCAEAGRSNCSSANSITSEYIYIWKSGGDYLDDIEHKRCC